MNDKQKWIMLVYKLPKARTSAGKVALWRKLKKIGVYQIQDSVCILPLSEKNTEDFEWISAEVVEMGGDASVWTIVAMSPEKEKKAGDFFLEQVNSQYQKMIKDIEIVTCKEELKKKWSYFHRIKSQDHLKSPLTVEVKAAFEKRMEKLRSES